MGLRMDDLHAPTVASGPTSNGAGSGSGSARLSVAELATKKEQLEAQLSALGAVLDSHGVNMNTSLISFDGYPRADIDVAQIRTTRAQIIRLRNDYKSTMSDLEAAVHAQFAAGANSNAKPVSSEPLAAPAPTASATPALPTPSSAPPRAAMLPFARVNNVVPDSPAAQAGLTIGDRVTEFGIVNWTNHERLRKVAQVVQQSENCSIPVYVLRFSAEQPLLLHLTPRRGWGGQGMLGCHLVPL